MFVTSFSFTVETSTDWETDWGDWNDKGDGEEGNMEVTEDQTEASDDSSYRWLQDAVVSVSPAADLIALANDNRMVLLARRFQISCLDQSFVYMQTLFTMSPINSKSFFSFLFLCILKSQL